MKRYTVKFDYSNKATFDSWEDFVNFVGLAFDGGLNEFEVGKEEDEDNE